MDGQSILPQYYAILIGIDAYPCRPLKGCVRDVEMIKDCLESQVNLADTRLLTAGGAADAPQSERWPTCGNITFAFESITSQAQPGDCVYIHYSGHGTRMSPLFDYSDQSTGDLALVLLGDNQSRNIFLRGPRLAGFINAMVNKGLAVTLVLDCCFSASVYRRSDENVRYLPNDSETALASAANSHDYSADRGTPSANRDGSMRDNWLVDPDGYAILAACGPHENAKGGFEKSEKSGWHGALSYLLLKALPEHGLQRRHKDIYRHLCAKLRHTGVQQHPVLYGNEEQGFFGRATDDYAVRPICIVVRDGNVQLLAGQAHGLHEGDLFAVYPSYSTKCRDAGERCVARVVKAGRLTSDLSLPNAPSGPHTGWIAEQLTSSHLSRLAILLQPGLLCYDALLMELRERSLGTSASSNQAPALQVIFNPDNGYDIFDGSGVIISSNTASLESQEQAHHICDLLEHVARFNMAKKLGNSAPAASFREACHVQVVYGQEVFRPGEHVNIRHSDILNVVVENRGSTTLYAHVYNLGPCWQVKSLLRATYKAIAPRQQSPNGGGVESTGVFSSKIKMTVPGVLYEQGSCEDIIKVFITSQPTSFDSIELPNMHELAQRKSGGRISDLSTEISEDWVAFNFPIRTSI